MLGVKTQRVDKLKQPREYPIEFSAVESDSDSFEIALPAGYQVDDLPPAVDVEYSFASYHSTTQVENGAIHYRRTYQVKQLTVPAGKVEEVQKFYQVVAGDERNMVVLRQSGK